MQLLSSSNCPRGTKRILQTYRSGMLGLGGRKTIDLGCMTSSEYQNALLKYQIDRQERKELGKAIRDARSAYQRGLDNYNRNNRGW